MENAIKFKNLVDVAEAFQEWIMAVPDDIASRLPAMPGIDGDYADKTISDAREALGLTRYKSNSIPHEPVQKNVKTTRIEGKNGPELMRKVIVKVEVPSFIDPSEKEQAFIGYYDFWVTAEVSQGVQRLLATDAFRKLEITKDFNLDLFCICAYDENNQVLRFPTEREIDADLNGFSAVFIKKQD